MDSYLKLQSWWNKTSPDIVTTTTSQTQVEELEQRYTIRLPDDFKEYLLNSCPVGEARDAECSTWWSLGRIRSIPEEYEHEISNLDIAKQSAQHLFFADYSIWCWAWAISCTNDDDRGKIALIGGMPDRFVADSFSDFVRRYTNDFRSVC